MKEFLPLGEKRAFERTVTVTREQGMVMMQWGAKKRSRYLELKKAGETSSDAYEAVENFKGDIDSMKRLRDGN